MRKMSKILLVALLPIIVLSPFVIFNSFSTIGQDAAPRQLVWIIDENYACLNPSFCQSGPGMYTVQVSATAFSDHSAFVIILLTTFSKSGTTLYRSIERDHATWSSVRSSTSSLGGTNQVFVLSSGVNRSTVFVNGHWHTTTRHIQNFVTGVPELQGSFGCKELTGTDCPNNVSAHLSVTQVDADSQSALALEASLARDFSMPEPRTGEITWIVSANLGCFNSDFCQPSGGTQSKAGTWLLFSNHVAFGVVIGTQFGANGLVTQRYEEHVTATVWKIAPGSSGTNDFWIVSGFSSTTVYSGGAQHTTVAQVKDLDTGAPAQQTVFDCAQILGASCPGDASAFESVTPVS
jgi:hypothetical protein